MDKELAKAIKEDQALDSVAGEFDKLFACADHNRLEELIKNQDSQGILEELGISEADFHKFTEILKTRAEEYAQRFPELKQQ